MRNPRPVSRSSMNHFSARLENLVHDMNEGDPARQYRF